REEQWNDPHARCLGMLLDGRARATGIRRRAHDPTVLLIVNAYHEGVNFRLPEVAGGREWRLLVDTGEPERPSDAPTARSGEEWMIDGRTLLLFELKADGGPAAAGLE